MSTSPRPLESTAPLPQSTAEQAAAPEATFTGVFDISDADGVNESERLLMRLCRRSFLSLWSFANLHTDQDMRGGRGSAKEFADVLVVFGNDVVIFSDKHVAFQEDRDLGVAWRRWYKRAVEESAKQLHGAMSWARRFPKRVFLDTACTRPLPVALPSADSARFHLVAVTRGSYEACARFFSGSLGTLQIRTDVRGSAHADNPFFVGLVNPEKAFVHVFDEFSLEMVLKEMDTASDFISYLKDREAFLNRQDRVVYAAGEEQLLASYLTNGDELGRNFLPPSAREEEATVIAFDETHYESLMSNPSFREKKRLDKPSYLWDRMVERFIRLGDPELIAPGFDQDNNETEQALRLLARESRFRRRILVDAIRGVLTRAADEGRQAARVFTTDQDTSLVYVFVLVPKRANETYDDYRGHRIAVLHAYCKCAKLRFPEGSTFIGIAFDHPTRDYRGSSEDLFVYICEHLGDEEREEAERYRQELGILPDNMELKRMSTAEFPAFVTKAQPVKNDTKRPSKNDERKRNRSKMAKASRKRNRRR
ncbi:hypothetical protein AWB80_01169 [Caballeronia pedi]|uniref:Uncharacterized protein n=1 Tax=Caballeronia pedi TaxID=1777141 RepID=A0A157ZR78_9BURK|nr:hypothetical protein [Caballeronia pedi]SAK48001.1 hypothetical protein AWB80_01169 [Caballeronia pedi]